MLFIISISVTSDPPGIPGPVTVEPIIIPVKFDKLVITFEPLVIVPCISYTLVGVGNKSPNTVMSFPIVTFLLNDTSPVTLNPPFNDISSANINV